jgi:hypothetical protein
MTLKGARRWQRIAIAVLGIGGVVGLTATSAGAVSTTDFTLTPSPVHGLTPIRIVVHAGRKTMAGVELTNRTAHELTVTLSEEVAKQSASGTFTFGGPAPGVAAYVHVADDSVKLSPHQSTAVDVIVDVPRTMQGFALVTAASQPIGGGAVSVVERLGVLIQVKGPTGPPPPKSSSSPLPYVIAAIVVVGLLLLLLLFLRRRRRGKPAASGGRHHEAPGGSGAPSPVGS